MASEPAARGLPGVGATALPYRSHTSTSSAATEPCEGTPRHSSVDLRGDLEAQLVGVAVMFGVRPGFLR